MDKVRGGAREGSGRKSKAAEQSLIEKLTPLEEVAFRALEKALKEEKDWAVKLFFNYQFGMPKQMVVNENINYKEEELTPEKIESIKSKITNAY